MTKFQRASQLLLIGCATAALSACGADDVASPGAGAIDVVVNPPAPTPTPGDGGTTPTPPTATEFASAAANATPTAEAQLAIVQAGSNNNINGFGTKLNGVYPVANASFTPASNPQTVLGNTSFIDAASFIGALNGPNDTSFSRWTCNSDSAVFTGSTSLCTDAPAIGTGGSSATCPTGTTDDGLVATFRACLIPQAITSNLTLPRIQGVFYRLSGQTEVGDTSNTGGVTLTIEPGVTVVANSQSDTVSDVLVVNRGSKLQAVGTADAPIIFTAEQNVSRPSSFTTTSQGLWGGVILLGRSPTAVCSTGTNDADGTNANCQAAIEGITNRFYGGTDKADNSGAVQYVQIRYSGIIVGTANELQGLTLGGVGSGTTIDHVQVHNSSDDGIEIFGGTSNIKYFAVTGADDDAFDVDNGWRGYMQYIIAAQKPTGATNDSFATEIDSNGNEDYLPRTFGRYANFTFLQRSSATSSNAPAAIRLRGGADFKFVNGIVQSVANQACVNIISATTVRAADPALQDVGPPTFDSVYFQCQGR